jgi:hypothetical protein
LKNKNGKDYPIYENKKCVKPPTRGPYGGWLQNPAPDE